MRPVRGMGWYCWGLPLPRRGHRAQPTLLRLGAGVAVPKGDSPLSQALLSLTPTFGVFPHDFRRRVPINGAVQHPGFTINAILVVGLDHKTRRH